MERDWRPSDAVERLHGEDRVELHHKHMAEKIKPETDDEGVFTAEEPVERPERPL